MYNTNIYDHLQRVIEKYYLETTLNAVSKCDAKLALASIWIKHQQICIRNESGVKSALLRLTKFSELSMKYKIENIIT